MISGTDLGVLKALADLGGKAHIRAVAARAGVSSHYAEMVVRGLGGHDYMDVSASGTCRMIAKGWQALRAAGWRSADDGQGEETGQPGELIGAEQFLKGWQSKLERGEITEEEYRQKRIEILVRIARRAK